MTFNDVETLRVVKGLHALTGAELTCESIRPILRLSVNGAWKRLVSLEGQGLITFRRRGITRRGGISLTRKGEREVARLFAFRHQVIDYLVRLEMSQYASLIAEVNKRKFEDAKHGNPDRVASRSTEKQPGIGDADSEKAQQSR